MYQPFFDKNKSVIDKTEYPNASMWFYRFEKTVAENLDDIKLSNKRLAKLLNISEVHLTRRVKEVTGSTPAKYIRKRRMVKAMELLKSDASQTEKKVSDKVGFLKPRYFSKKFEEFYGKKPNEVLVKSNS